MAGNITVTIAANAIGEIWASTALDILRKNCIMPKLVTHDSDIADFRTMGDVLHIPYTGVSVANAKVAGSVVTLNQPTMTDTTCTLNKHYESSVLIEDPTRAMSSVDLRTRLMESQMISLAEQVEADLCGLYSQVVGTNTVGTYGTGVIASLLRTLRKTQNDNLCPKQDRSLVVGTSDEISILGDTNLATYFSNTQPQAIREGSIGRAYGYDIYVDEAIVDPGTGKANLAFNKGAFLLASRPLPPPPSGSGVNSTTVTDPMTGLVFNFIEAYSPTYLGVQMTTQVLYGVAVLRLAKACVVKGAV